MSVKVTSMLMEHVAGYECADCGKMFRRDAALRRHRELSHEAGARRYRCDICRRPFTSQTTLSVHLSVAHGAATRSTSSGESGVRRQCDASDRELVVLVEDCCVDDEICIAADGESADFQTAVTTHDGDNEDHVSRQSSADVVSRSQTSSVPVAITASHCGNNNNNNQTKNKNVAAHAALVCGSAVRAAVNPTIGSSTIIRSHDVKLPTVNGSTSLVQAGGVNGFPITRKPPQPASTTAATSVVATSTCTTRTGLSRAAVEPSKPAANTRASADSSSQQQKTPKSPLEAETVHGDADKPGDGGPAVSALVPTSTTQKIIVYVKTEPNHQQQIAYCAAESTTSTVVKGSALPCQFVCPVCGRDFASEKYLSMHVSSIHRAANDVASVIALETATAPTTVAHRPSVAGSPINAADAPQAVAAGAGGTLQTAQPSSSTSVGGSKSHWTCNICQKAFAQNSSYKNHIRTHSDDRPYVCSICSIGFKERYHLKKHELFKHTNTLNETCRICGKRFKDSTAVRAHERIHSDVRPYGCPLCGKTFKTSECLWHHENRSKTCGKMASRNKHLGVARIVTIPRQRQRRATIAATSELPYQASSTSTPPRIESVQEDVKPELVDLLPLAAQGEKVECSPALLKASSENDVEDSEVVIKMEPHCDFDVDLNTMLESADTSFVDFWPNFDELDAVTPEYTAVEHDLSSPPDAVCSSPDTTDADSTRSADEVSTAAVGSTSSCSAGVAGCTAVKRYDCARCDKRFASSATLAKHLQVHAEIRPYRCTVCDIGFKLKVHLKKHNLYRHSEEYPCECSICGKRFKDSSAVRLHERIHSTARPFQCLHCGKSFKTRENLWGHRNRGPCEQRSLLVTSSTASYPVSTSNLTAPQFVANNVRLFHSPEFGPILGVPVNAKLVFKDGMKPGKVEERPASVAMTQPKPTTPISLLTGSVTTNLRRVSAVRVGDTTRLAVTKVATSCGSDGLSLVPTAVVTPIKREMITDHQKLSSLVSSTSTSVLTGNLVLSAPSATRHVANQKRSIEQVGPAANSSPQKYLAVAADDDDKLPCVQRLLSSPHCGETMLSPDTEQNLADALSALAGSDPDAMVIEGDCLPSIGETESDWPPSASTDYTDDLDVRDDDWSELVAASCNQLLTSTDDDDALSDAASLSEYHALLSSPAVGHSTSQSPAATDHGTDTHGERSELASDTMWCNWAPENDLGSLLIFGP